MEYTYKVRDQLGNIHDGEVEAENEEEATQLLRADGFQVVELHEASGGADLFKKRIKRTEIVYMTSQLAIMIDTGITIASALDALAEHETNSSLKEVLSALKNRVENGDDFSKALAEHPKVFDETYIALTRAAEQTGGLGEMLDRIALYLRNELDTRGKVKAAMAYPAVMVVLSLGITSFLLTFILPKFMPMFKKKEIDLPLPTIVLTGVSESLTTYWYAWIAGLIAAIGGFLYARKTQIGRQVIDFMKINLPVVGAMNRKVIISRSVRTLGTMIQSGVSMLDSIELTAAVSGNYYYEQLWRGVLDEITQGNRIADSIRGNPLFPPTLVQMISSGEETGKLDYVLNKVSMYYDREVDSAVKAATSIIEPIMITVMGSVVGGIGFAIMLPIFKLSTSH